MPNWPRVKRFDKTCSNKPKSRLPTTHKGRDFTPSTPATFPYGGYLGFRIQPRIDTSSRLSALGVQPTTGLSDYGTGKEFAKTSQGSFWKITWGGESEWESPRPSGVRRSVWEHLNSLSAGAVYSPTPIRLNYNRLSQLRGVESVNLSKTLRWDTSLRRSKWDCQDARPWMSMCSWSPSHPMTSVGVGHGPKRREVWTPFGNHIVAQESQRVGAESAFEFAFGYVAVQPFASLNSEGLLNSGEWTLRHSKHLIGVRPLPLSWFRSSTEPTTWIDIGLDREVWPEFTRTQFHFQYDLGYRKPIAKRRGALQPCQCFVREFDQPKGFI